MASRSIRIRPARRDELGLAMRFTLRTLVEGLALRGRRAPRGLARKVRERWGKVLESPESGLFFAEDRRGQRVGFLWVGVSREILDDSEIGWVYDIHVDRRYRGRGIGGLLLRAAVRWVAEAGYDSVGLMVDARNSRAVELYRSQGFRPDRFLMYRVVRPAHRRAVRARGARSEPP